MLEAAAERAPLLGLVTAWLADAVVVAAGRLKARRAPVRAALGAFGVREREEEDEVKLRLASIHASSLIFLDGRVCDVSARGARHWLLSDGTGAKKFLDGTM